MPRPKEPNFFCDNVERSETWYRGLFEGSEGCEAIGEASVAYSLVERNPGTPARIARRVPGARLLYIVRHPLRRLESAWRHHIRDHNSVPRDFAKAVRTFRPILEGTLYMRNLDCYRRHYPDERIHVLFLKDFAADPAAELQRCDRFLDVDPGARGGRASYEKKNETAKRKRLHSLVYKIHYADWWQPLRRLIPDALRHFVVRRTRQELPGRPTWDLATRRWALDQIREDAQAILSYAGKPPDFWTLDPEPTFG